jgi:hypothetical protein
MSTKVVPASGTLRLIMRERRGRAVVRGRCDRIGVMGEVESRGADESFGAHFLVKVQSSCIQQIASQWSHGLRKTSSYIF